MGISSFLKKVSGNVLDHYPELRDATTWNEHVAAGLRLELKSCPVCSESFKDHRFARLASIRIGKGFPSATSFLDSLKRHDWDDLVKHQSGEEKPDNAEVCVLACVRGGLAALLVHTPFEPWDYKSVVFCTVLAAEDADNLKKLVHGDLWMPLEK